MEVEIKSGWNHQHYLMLQRGRIIIYSEYRADLVTALINTHTEKAEILWDFGLEIKADIPDRVWDIILNLSDMNRMVRKQRNKLLALIGDLDAFEQELAPALVMQRLKGVKDEK